MAKSKNPPPPAVHVVLDTNVLFTELEDKLLCKEISDLILNDTSALGIDISWHIPDVVRQERRSQMFERAIKLLIPLGKLENLLGHKLNMTPDIVANRVDDAISRQISSHKLHILQVDPNEVDWHDLISRAASREPPFSANGSEKGFKDSIVVESFFQLSSRQPKSNCRVILLSSDELVANAVDARVARTTNAGLAKDIGALKTILNAIASHLSDEAVAKILPRANSLIFTKAEDKSALWFKWELFSKLQIDGIHISKVVYEKGFKTKHRTIDGLQTNFEKKEGQRVYFQTKVTARVEATKDQTITNQTSLIDAIARLNNTIVSKSSADSTNTSLVSGNIYQSDNPMSAAREEIKKNGIIKFDINWSCTLTSRGSLIKPNLESIKHESTKWTDA